MKILAFIKIKNIGLRSVNEVCEFLHIEKKSINSTLNSVEVRLIEETLTQESFETWLNLKKQILRLQLKRAEILLKNLNYDSKTEIDEDLGYQIIYALKYLLSENRFSTEIHKNLTSIINSNIETREKVSRLKRQEPFAKIDRQTIKNQFQQKKSNKSHNINNRDSYENYYWGGLSGEEAYEGFWNTN